MDSRANHIIRITSAILLSACATLRAEVFYVSPDGNNTTGLSWATALTSIQAAIDRAVAPSGDQIRVRQGAYEISSPIVLTRPIAVLGGYLGTGDVRNPAAFVTLINGKGNALHCFHITASATLDGLWITGGRAVGEGPDGCGGAVYIDACDPTINDCTFESNTADTCGGAIYARTWHTGVISDCSFVQNVAGDQGGGIYLRDCDLTITRCTFTQNKGQAGSTTRGGAIFNKSAAPTIDDCIFSGNGATEGAGIFNAESYPTITNCTFAGCNLGSHHGGGLYDYQSSVTMRNCLFYGHDVSGSGGAIYEGEASGGTIVNCVIRDNSVANFGGGIYTTSTTTKFINCTIYGNRSSSRGGGLFNNYGEPVLTNCILWGNTATTDGAGICDYATTTGYKTVVRYSDIQGATVYPGMGNILAGPQFVNADGDNLHLSGGSPCIDVGDGSIPHIPLEDFDGSPRIVDGDRNGTAVIDLGAYEYQAGHAISDRLHRIHTYQGVIYDNPSDITARYVFVMEFQTNNLVEHIAFLTPGGMMYVIPNDPSTSSGDIQTYHRIDGTAHYWGHWGMLTSSAALARYGSGTYTIAVHYENGATQQTTVAYNIPQTTVAVPQPTRQPDLIAPAYRVSITSPVAFTWQACTDPNMVTSGSRIRLTVMDSAATTVLSESYSRTATNAGPYGLPEGWYDLELAFENFFEVINPEGIPFEYGKAAVVLSEFEVINTSVYRFWSSTTGRHFYTISESEKDKLVKTYSDVWKYEGPVFKTCATPYYPNLAQVHRFWSPTSGAHFYTIVASERDKLISQFSHAWTYEGPAFYAYPKGAEPPQAKPVYRFWKAQNNTHFYTLSESEKQKLITSYANVYFYEGVAFYACE